MKKYIIVAYLGRIPYTLQGKLELHWYFEKKIKSYTRLGSAIKMANKVNSKYCCDRIVVFGVNDGDTLSSDNYATWKDKVEFEINNV